MSLPGSSEVTRRGALTTMAMALAVAGCTTLKGPDVAGAGRFALVIETSAGDIGFTLDVARSPNVARWFLGLADAGSFDGTRFWRSGHLAGHPSTPQFIEGGMLDKLLLGEASQRLGSIVDSGLPYLREWETTTQSGLIHTRGYVGLGRDIVSGGEVIPEIVIGVSDTPQMDAGGGGSPGNTGFPILGFVTHGMNVVDRIAGGERKGTSIVPFLAGQVLTRPVQIKRIRRARLGEARA